MNRNKETKEKVCAFFASDYHFEMISLPYINKNLEQNKEIIILTENDLDKTIEVLLSRMNLEDNKKRKVLEINWKQDDLNKFKKIKKDIKDKKDIIILIKGKENYINNVNENINRWIENRERIKIIDCYDMDEVGNDLDSVMSKYEKVLSTTGEKEIQKI